MTDPADVTFESGHIIDWDNGLKHISQQVELSPGELLVTRYPFGIDGVVSRAPDEMQSLLEIMAFCDASVRQTETKEGILIEVRITRQAMQAHAEAQARKVLSEAGL